MGECRQLRLQLFLQVNVGFVWMVPELLLNDPPLEPGNTRSGEARLVGSNQRQTVECEIDGGLVELSPADLAASG